MTMIKSKNYKPAEEVLQSLINLRDELYNEKNPYTKQVFYKINSCLYDEYPLRWKDDRDLQNSLL